MKLAVIASTFVLSALCILFGYILQGIDLGYGYVLDGVVAILATFFVVFMLGIAALFALFIGLIIQVIIDDVTKKESK